MTPQNRTVTASAGPLKLMPRQDRITYIWLEGSQGYAEIKDLYLQDKQ